MPETGLTTAAAIKLRQKFGENVLPAKAEGLAWFFILLNQFKSPLIYILLVVGVVSIIFREWVDAILSLVVVAMNALMGFFQEYHAQKTLAALRQIIKPLAMVIRDSARQEIEAKYLVPGDIVMLASGDRVPADGVIVQGVGLLLNEAILTGEEEAVK
ncbi:MAG: cation-transporting P-type ATPase, partial [Candidatus Komeilibacteria bacterium]|nr:cation-transporting P-type ATPase [Candidatus Komeilibacteria bacterium]